MRILVGAELLTGHGGQDRSLVELVEAFRRKDQQVSVTYRVPGPFLDRYRAAGVDAAHVSHYMIVPERPWRTGRELAEAVHEGWRASPDVVYINQLTDSPWGAAVALLRRAPLVCHLRLPPPRRFGVQWRAALPAVSRFVAVSEFTKRQHVAAGIDEDAIVVVRNGVDPSHYRPPVGDEREAARAAIGLDRDAPVVLFYGRIDVGKGVGTLLDAWAIVRRHDPGAQLVIAGAPQHHEEGRAAALRYAEELRARSSPDVVWAGHHEDVRPLLWAADVVVVPSEWPEPSARAILETMAAGVPVVISDAGGMPEFLPDDLRPFPAGDAHALAAAISSRLDWRVTSPGLGHAVRRHVTDGYELDAAAERMLEVFGSARAGGGGARRRHVHDLGSWGR